MSARVNWPACVNAAPPGWRWGAHTSGPGWEGYYLVGVESASLIAVQRPDMAAEDAPGENELWASWLAFVDGALVRKEA